MTASRAWHPAAVARLAQTLGPMTKTTDSSKTARIVTAAFGLLFAALAVAIIVISDRTIGPLLAAAVVGVLGVDAIASAYRNKPSLLSRIGPLP